MVNIWLEWERVETRRAGWRLPVLVGCLEDAAFVKEMGSDGGFSVKDSPALPYFAQDPPPPPLGYSGWTKAGGEHWAWVEHRDQVVRLQESRQETVASVSSHEAAWTVLEIL